MRSQKPRVAKINPDLLARISGHIANMPADVAKTFSNVAAHLQKHEPEFAGLARQTIENRLRAHVNGREPTEQAELGIVSPRGSYKTRRRRRIQY